jgi:hypothetical protein
MKGLRLKFFILLHSCPLTLWGCGFLTAPDTTLDINEDDLKVAILAPATDADLTDITFDPTAANTPVILSLLLKNHGELDAENLVMTVTNSDGSDAPYAFAGGAYPGTSGAVSGTCTDSLAAAKTCTIVLEFSPTSAGTFTATLEVSYFNGPATVSGDVDLSGTAIP